MAGQGSCPTALQSPSPAHLHGGLTFTGRRWELLKENQKFKLAQQRLRQCLEPCCAEVYLRKKKERKKNNNNIEHAKQSEEEGGCFNNASHLCLGRLREHYSQAQSSGTFKV